MVRSQTCHRPGRTTPASLSSRPVKRIEASVALREIHWNLTRPLTDRVRLRQTSRVCQRELTAQRSRNPWPAQRMLVAGGLPSRVPSGSEVERERGLMRDVLVTLWGAIVSLGLVVVGAVLARSGDRASRVHAAQMSAQQVLDRYRGPLVESAADLADRIDRIRHKKLPGRRAAGKSSRGDRAALDRVSRCAVLRLARSAAGRRAASAVRERPRHRTGCTAHQ
jgi:hypothetical protein